VLRGSPSNALAATQTRLVRLVRGLDRERAREETSGLRLHLDDDLSDTDVAGLLPFVNAICRRHCRESQTVEE